MAVRKFGTRASSLRQHSHQGNLLPGQTVEYIITDSESSVPNDRVRTFPLWEGWFGIRPKEICRDVTGRV